MNTPRTDAAEKKCRDEHGYHDLVGFEDMREMESTAQRFAEAIEVTPIVSNEFGYHCPHCGAEHECRRADGIIEHHAPDCIVLEARKFLSK